MNRLVHRFQEYVAQSTHTRVEVHELEGVRLPQYLAQLYALWLLKVDERYFMGIMLREPGAFRPARFEKQLGRLLENHAQVEGYCLIADMLPGYVRRRLVERQIPFVVPGRQLSWPALGAVVEARQGDKSGLMTIRDRVMPATQVVILGALNGALDLPEMPKTLAERFGYTTMTMSRALDEIEAHQLGRVTRAGRERLLDFPGGASVLWGQAVKRLGSPVVKTVRVWKRDMQQQTTWWAGETALAKQSLLTAPAEPVVALGRDAWKALAANIEIIPIPEQDTCQAQVWKYDPGLLASGDVVDRYSLYLSLQDEEDERVRMTLEELMGAA